MTAKSDYRDDEWALLLSAMAMTGFAMMAVSTSGTLGKLRELAALHTCLMAEHVPAEFQRNELVMALVRHFQTVPPAPASPGGAVGRTGATSGLAAAPRTLVACCERVAALLAAKTPVLEAEGYKRWLLWIATRVAEAPGAGWLANRRTITPEEEELLRVISSALRVAPYPPTPTPAELEELLDP